MPESGELNQTQLEQAIKLESPQQAETLRALEQEKIAPDEQPTQNLTPLQTPVLYGEGKSNPHGQTKDFVEKHGGLTRRREKKHTGRDLHPQHEEEGERKKQTVQAEDRLNQFSLKEALAESVDDYEGDYVRFDEFGDSEKIDVDGMGREFKSFFDSLDNRRSRDQSLVEKYSSTENKIDRLKLLSRMHITDAALAVVGSDEPGSRYLLKKLDFYKDLLEGKATRKRQQYDYDKREYVEVEEPIPAEELSPENVVTGLMRNILYAEMKGTPELAAFNIAMRRGKEQNLPTDRYGRQRCPTSHMPALFGYHSQIFYGQEGNGHYGALADVYNDALRVAAKDKKVETSPEAMEHRAVMLAAEWYTKAMEYNDPGRSQHSPYSSLKRDVDRGLKESIAWAQLGEPVQRQLRGMRQKIQGVDLHNIGRFIGKAGDDKYGRELRKIHWELKNIPSDPDQREEWALRRTVHDIARVDKQHRKKQEAVMFRLERKKLDITELELPDEERTLQLQSVTTRYEEELRRHDEEYQTESQRVRTRTPEQLIEELKARQETLKPKHERHKSLAEKALDLHFRFNGHDKENNTDQATKGIVDWINDADLGLINWSHNALQRGVSQDAVMSYVIAKNAFPDRPMSRDLLELMKKQNPNAYLVHNLRAVSTVLQQLEISATPEEIVQLTSYDVSLLPKLIERGYTKEALIQHQWLNDHSLLEQEMFPFDKNRGAQEAWCTRNAFYIPDGWRRKSLGGLILNRLGKGIDPNLHDASFWLAEFELPDQRGGTVYRNRAKELSLLYALTSVPKEEQFRVPKNPNKYNDLFSDPAHLALYEAMLPLFTSSSIDKTQFNSTVAKLLSDLDSRPEELNRKQIDITKYKDSLENASLILTEMYRREGEREKIPVLIADLRTLAGERKQAIDEAYNWFMNHSDTPHTLLTFAWQNRSDALANGCEDNPRAIKQWADLNGLRVAYEEMEKNGELPPNFSQQDITKMAGWASELIRCYDGRKVITELAYIKDHLNKDYLITPQKIDLGEGWQGEIFQKDDPRGMTIGHDTGCCMTLGGASESCIRAGYNKPPYGFLALSRDGKVVAQSFLYTNPDQAPNTLVLDNIEANQGRDMSQVVQRYREFFETYLQDQLRRDYGTEFTNVNVGTGYTQVGLDDCPVVSQVFMPNPGIYTDAHSQHLLYSMSPELIEKCKQYDSQVFDASSGWDSIRQEIMTIERSAFQSGQQYSKEQLNNEFMNPNGVNIVMRKGSKIVGYCTAFPTAYRNEKALYVSSTAFLPEFQGKGLVSDLMYTLEVEAQRQGYTVLTRHAMVENGYADKLEKNYEILEKQDVKGPAGLQRFLAMRIPLHPQSTLLEKKPKEVTTTKTVVTPLSANDVQLIANMERQCYPEDMRQGIEFFEEVFAKEQRVRQEVGRDDLRFSYFVRKGGSPAGYIIVSPETSEVNPQEAVAHIDDIAILPQFRGSEAGRELISTVLDMVKAYKQEADNFSDASVRFKGAIEMEARESTSYRLLTNPRAKRWFETKGYYLVTEKKLSEYLGGEDFYFLRYEYRPPSEQSGLAPTQQFEEEKAA